MTAGDRTRCKTSLTVVVVLNTDPVRLLRLLLRKIR
jgi:hypothetical protein